MPRLQLFIPLAAVALASGCTTILQADWDKPFQTGGAGGTGGAGTGGAGGAASSSSSSSSSSSAGGGGEVDAGPDAGPPCETPKTAIFACNGDTAIVSGTGSCGAINYGGADHLSVNVNLVARALTRFNLSSDPATLSAIQGASWAKATLTLARTPDGGDCGSKCPAHAGTIQVYPMRNDWVEGTSTSYTGATWCKYSPASNANWDAPGADGPLDHGGSAGSVALATGDESIVEIPIDPAGLMPWLDTAKSELSFLLVPEDGAIYVFASREHATLPRPALRVDYCP